MAGLIPFLLGLSFFTSLLATLLVRRIAPRFGLVDRPGGRKIHAAPKPLGGGIAIYLAVVAPMVAGLAMVHFFDPPARFAGLATHWGGIRHQTPLALGLAAALTGIHLLGLMDDRKPLGPYLKLAIQLGITATLVIGFDLRALTVLGYWPSVFVTILWIAGITNALNFLDNMDGLSAGVAAVAAAAFLVTALQIDQWFVAAMLALLLGALAGFLLFNFSPASIFMGDSGSLIIGFLLGVLTIRTTFLPPGTDLANGWYALLAPMMVLAVPLYDLLVVSAIRLSRGKSPFVGDTNHLSHRLVRRGMSRRTAVLCIWLMTAATSIAAIILPHIGSGFGAMMLFAQTLLMLGLVALLEQHPLPAAD